MKKLLTVFMSILSILCIAACLEDQTPTKLMHLIIELNESFSFKKNV